MDEYTESFTAAPANIIRLFYLLLTFGAWLVVVSAPSELLVYKLIFVFSLLLLCCYSCCSCSLNIYVIEHNISSGWYLLTAEGSYQAVLMPDSVVTRYISILYFIDTNKNSYCVICFGGLLASFNYKSLRYLLLLSTL